MAVGTALAQVRVDFIRGDEPLALSPPLVLQPRIEDDLVVIEQPDLAISVHAPTIEEAREALDEQMAVIRETFIEARDEDLPAASRRVKHRWSRLIGGHSVATAARA